MDDNLHLIRYGTHAEQKYLINEFLDCYDILIVNANMAAFSSSGIASFISEKAKNKNFIIDPLTHGFQESIGHLQNSDGEIKSSIKSYWNGMGIQ